MNRLRLLLALSGLVVLAAAVPAGAVSGGQRAAIADAPYIAWLPSGCTGTLIAPDRVLTAGHCLEGFSPIGYSVLLGKDGNAAFKPGQEDRFKVAIENGGVPARGFAINPRFKESFPFAHRSPQNAIAQQDVGVILLDRPVTDITPVGLPAAGSRSAEKTGERASIFGYGLTSSKPTASPKSLLTGRMTVISAAACKHAYPRAIIKSELCGQDLRHHAPLVQACPGDSGGPFIRQTASGPVQIGITSWGPEVKDAKCGRERLPGVSMRTSSFASFIHDPNPVIQPYPAASLEDLASEPKVTGIGKVGETLTCTAPAFAGSPSTLAYQWILNFKTVSRRPTLTVSRAMIGHRMGCNVTARNASGHFEVFTPAINRVRVTG